MYTALKRYLDTCYNKNFMAQYVCVLDFEATCWEDSNNHEIIEFPSVLLRWDGDKIEEIGRIQQYVKPKSNPVVSAFCQDLTGISQDTVNNGIELKTAIKTHSQWLQDFAQHDEITIVTCGHWDLKTMLPSDLKNIKMKPEPIYTRYVNLKDLFKTVTNTKALPMTAMLNYFKLNLEGRHHSGLDDCHNLARIFMELVKKGMTKKTFANHLVQL